METDNQTISSEFILLGLSEKPEQETLLFALFLCMYVVTIVGNLLIILAISTDSHLHTPMYFFLANLSLVDFCLATDTVPKMLVSIQIKSKSISYSCCLTQMYFFHFFGIMVYSLSSGKEMEVWLHMELGIVSMGWSYELFWEFLDMQKGAGCNSVTLWAIGPPIEHFSLKEESSVGKDLRVCLNFRFGH